MMKVLVISHLYPRRHHMTHGIFVHEQARALQSLGVDVKIICPVPFAPQILGLNKRWRAYHQIPPADCIDGLDVYYPRVVTLPRGLLLSRYGWLCYQGIKHLIKTMGFGFDLIHAHTAIPSGYAAQILQRKLQIPVVLTIHGLDLASTAHKSAACRRSVLSAIQGASQTVLVSAKLKKQLHQLDPVSAGESMVIANGIDPTKISQAIQNPAPAKNGRRVLLSVGNLYPSKGHDLVIRALPSVTDKHPDIVYRIVGDGPRKNQLQKLARETGVQHYVEFLGRLPHLDALRQVAACDVFVLPSWSEAFGVVYLEAMGAGKPVIGCLGEGIEDFVEHSKTGYLVRPKDAMDLSQRLVYILDHPAEAAAVGEAAQQYVTQNYTWQQNAKKYYELYYHLLASISNK